MRKLVLLAIFILSACFAGFAQDYSKSKAKSDNQTSIDDVSAEDYEALLDGYLKVKFREFAYESLELTEEEIIALDPIFYDYMRSKSRLMDRRFQLMEEYREEMAEDDKVKDEQEETADFIEDYWGIDIDLMETRKDYFDKMEDVIAKEKAFRFFLLEQTLENRVTQERVVEYVPIIIEIDRSDLTYKRNVDRYNRWMSTNDITISGEVSLDHDYTYNGLRTLVNALSSAAEYSGAITSGMRNQTNAIMKHASMMREDKYSDTHADHAHKAFLKVASMIEAIQKAEGIKVKSDQVAALRKAAEKIDPNTLYTEQAPHVYNFFQKAQDVVNSISYKKVEGTSLKKQSSNYNNK